MSRLLTGLGVLMAALNGPVAAGTFTLRDGDRVVLLGNTLIERAQRYGHLETALVARFGDRRVHFRNLGWSGDTVWADSRGLFDPPARGYQRMLEHVGRLKPTVLILGYGGNESYAGEPGLPRFLAQYRKLISDLSARSAPDVRVVLLSIPPQQRPGLRRRNRSKIAQKDDNSLAVAPAWLPSRLPLPQARNRQIATCNAAIARFARSGGHAHVNLFTPLGGLRDATRPGGRLLFTVDGRALDSTGYRLATTAVTTQLFGTTSLTVRIVRDKGTDQAVVDGPLAISDARYKPGRLTLSARPGQFVLRVTGLPRGSYTLRVDGQDFGTHNTRELASGIAPHLSRPVAGQPALRRAIVAKNRLYFHRWRPQNTTYLFGFRKREQGNNAGEVAQFEKLVAVKETEIDKLKQQVVHRIEIVRAKKKP